MFNILAQNLVQRGFKVSCFNTSEEAGMYLNSEIGGQTIGFGGSMSLEQMGLYETLGKHNTVYWHQGIADKDESKETRLKANAAALEC